MTQQTRTTSEQYIRAINNADGASEIGNIHFAVQQMNLATELKGSLNREAIELHRE